MRLMSLSNIEAIKHTYIPFTEKFTDAFGKREKGGIWIVYGKAGSGKSRFVMDLAKEFAEIGMKVMFATLEMGYCSDFKQELHNAGINRSHSITYTEDLTCEDLDELLSRQRSPDVVIIDSIQYFVKQYDATAEKIIELRKKYRKKIFLYISHVEGKEVEGKEAYAVKRDSFVRINVAGYRAIYVGRGKAGKTGYYTIWEEGAEKFWLQNRKNNGNDFNGDNSTETTVAPTAKAEEYE